MAFSDFKALSEVQQKYKIEYTEVYGALEYLVQLVEQEDQKHR